MPSSENRPSDSQPAVPRRKSLLDRAAVRFAHFVVRRPGLVALLTLVMAITGFVTSALWLGINTNQLDLISQDLRQVQDVKRVVDMVGGTGHVIIALRGNDEEKLKAASDEIAELLLADKENIRNVTYKVSTEFVKERAALFMETEDLAELRHRIMTKLKDATARASPFFFEISPTEPVELQVDDIIEKYTKIGKKSIIDEYYISDDRKMLILTVKPMWATTDVAQTGVLREQLRERFAKLSETNSHGFSLVEDYSGEPDADGSVIQFGFTGSYINSYDDEELIVRSLLPVSSIAFFAIALVLVAFFRRKVGAVGFVVTGLAVGLGISYGFTLATVGELNMITSILAGILMANGEDFGIYQIYRLREELAKKGATLQEALVETVTYAGPASFVSAIGTGVAFLTLMFSDFRGFSQFGLLAGTGIFIIGLSMYAWIPSTLLLIERVFPGSALKLVGTKEPADAITARGDRIPKPGLILAGIVALTLPIAWFAPDVVFDYDSRALVAEEQYGIKLQDEINERMQIAADPVAIYTPDIESAKAVWDYYLEIPEEKRSTIDQVVSLYSFVPPPEQQAANAEILTAWREELADYDPNLMPEELSSRWDEAMGYLNAEPYTLDDVPPLYTNMFYPLPESKPENKGILTFIYPRVDTWDGKALLAFSEQVEEIETTHGTFSAAGSSILFATLARIVLADAKMFVALALILLTIILLVDTRSIKYTLVALLPLSLGVGLMLGIMALFDFHLNFMNIVVFPVILGYAVSQGVYYIHRFKEGTSPRAALTSVGVAVACSSLTTLAGWAALMAASHKGLKTMGVFASVGMGATLFVSFIVMPAVLQIIDDRRKAKAPAQASAQEEVQVA